MYLRLGKRLYGCAIFLVLIFSLPITVHAAEFVFLPASGSFPVGTDFTVKIALSPGTTTVNASDGTVTFDKELLSVVSVSKDGSAFSLWTADPSFSNSAGTISFSGGSPAGFSEQGTVISVKFKAKAVGTAAVSISKGSILAADGKGTDVYTAGTAASFTLTEAAPEPPKEEEAAAISEDTPRAPILTSSTHPKPENWYATSTVEVAWKLTPDVIGIRTILSDKDTASPTTKESADATSKRLTDVADGTWYMFVQFQNDLGWGEVAKRTVLIDTVPPDDFDFTLVEEDTPTPKFAFQSQDSLSGVERYEVVLGSAPATTVLAKDLSNGMYPVPPQEGGTLEVTIRAIDKAGNIREVKKEMTLPKVVKAAKGKAQEETEAPPFFTIERILLILFAMGMGGVISWNIYTGKIAAQEKMKILHEVSHVRDQNDKIFSAMREEFEDLINELDPKPQLTPAERDFMEKMKEALEISEELVDSGMEELKKVIRG